MRAFWVFSLAVCLAFPVHAEEAGTVARGRYLAVIGDCAGCHNVVRQPAFSGGLDFNTQFGMIYSTNITPDRETGIGGWSEDDFYRALHEGIAPGGRHLYPAFPYPYFIRLSREESNDLFAYLHTLKPVRRPPTPNRLLFPFNLRFGMFFWDLLYLDRSPPRVPATASAAWRRGEYLVNGPGHCAACHTPKNLLFGDQTDKPLTGGEVDSWFASDLTGGAGDGLGRWHASDITTFLATGENRFTAAAGSMKEKIASSTSRLRSADLAAIATYLKSLPPGKPQHWERPRPEQMARGQAVYTAYCQGCHTANGAPVTGSKTGRYPPLAANTMVVSHDPTTMLRVILTGGTAPEAAGAPPTRPMPGFARLDDGQIADVASYIRNAWGNSGSPVTATQAHLLRAALKLH